MTSKTGEKALKKVDYNPFSSGPFSAAIPTTEAQREIWATLALDPEATLCYNESISLELKGIVNPDLLNLAFQEVLKRHDALRSVFSKDGKFFFIKEFSNESIRKLDYSLEPGKFTKKMSEFEQKEIETKIDLVNGPLFFATLIKASDNHYVLNITGHHIICDGWSFAVILTELSTIYSAFEKNISFSFKEASQFRAYAVEENEQGANLQHKRFWLDLFKAPLETKKIPLDFPRPKYRTYNSARFDIAVPDDLVIRLKKFGASQGCSLYTVLMASFQILLGRLTQGSELVVGMASAAQSELGEHDLVGHLVNLLPLRSQVAGEESFKAYLKNTRTKMLDCFDHQLYSYGSLLKELNLKRDPSEIPLLNVVFNIDQQSPGQGLKFDGISAKYNTVARDFENFELFINAVSCENSLVIECQYNKNLFKESTIENWFKSYIELLESVITSSDSRCSSFNLPKLFIPALKALESEVVQTKKLLSDPAEEARLKVIWEKVLDLNNLSRNDNFFSVGGHSLLAVELSSLIQDEFKRDITIRDIFENPTLEELTSKILTLNKEVSAKAETIIPHKTLPFYPVTHNQMQVWYLEEMFPKTVMHNLPSSIRLRFAVDPLVLEKTLHFLIQRHPALRTAIVIEDGVPVQKVLDASLPQFKKKLAVEETSEKDIQAVLNKAAEEYFDKENPPLYHAKLHKLGKDDFVFYFMVHHAIWDGWCFDIFFDELNVIYSALVKNEMPVFKNNPEVTYTDYALWLHDQIDTGKLNHQLDFWSTKLKSPLPVLELPTDFKRPMTASHEGLTFPFELSSIQAERLRSYAKSQGTSLFNVMLAAFKVTLARYCNLEDIIVGSPVRARNSQKLLNTIGYFVNTVALRTNISIHQSFEEILKLVSTTCVEAFENQELPFQIVLNKVPHHKDSGRTPIFQTFFSYQDVSNRKALINNHPYTQINIDKASTHTDLDLWVKASDKKIEGAFEYRKDLFLTVTIERFYESFFKLLDNLTLNCDQPLQKIAVLPKKYSDLILNDWNSTSVDLSSSVPFHKTFEEMVDKFPTNVAIENSAGEITYSELNAEANKVAHALIKEGIAPGDLIGVSLTRDIKMMSALIGILKSGAGYVPLDPAFPQDRLDYMIESSMPKKLITDSSLEKRFSKFNNIVLIDDLLEGSTTDRGNPSVNSKLSDTMYIIYTSGSTGKPKGVQISHGALANFLISMAKAPGLSKNDKLLAVTTLSFDIATLEIYLPLTVGASLFLASSFDVIDGRALREIISAHQINVMQATPSTWRLLLASGWQGSPQFKVLCGGEAFPIDLAHKLVEICAEVWNMYGPTETTVWSTCKKLSLSDLIVTIGRPIDNTFAYILDEGLNLAPIGAPGELYLGGSGLAEGYFGRADLTNEKFIKNPFVANQKMYATGDFARFTADGEIECLGRQDGQVKVRGYRIELGEIEAVLSTYNEFSQNAVITKEVRPGDVRIIAFLVSNTKAFDERGLRESLSHKLPKYMVPSHFVILSELPQTLNGKIDKKSLAPMFADVAQAAVTKPAENEISSDSVLEALRSMWMEVLDLSKLSLDDNFFSIGGNSLLAVQLFSKIALKFKLNLPLSVLLETSDFQSFVKAVKTKLPGHTELTTNQQLAHNFSSLVSIKSGGSKNPIFCFHGVGGNVLNYMSLSPAAKDKRPLIGLQSKGMDGIQPMADSIEEMARFYISEIKSLQPNGPYYLSGGSMGGTIALEVAQQMTRQGDKIEKLVMFDTFGPKINIKVYDKNSRSFWKDWSISLSYKKKRFIYMIKSKLLSFLGAPLPLEIRLFNIEWNNYKALWKYQAQAYSGDLDLIRAPVTQIGWYSDPLMGWGGVIQGNIKTYEIKGTHSDFIESPELCEIFSKLV